MNEKEQSLIKIITNTFSSKLKPLVEDFIIKENKAFVTLKALDYEDAKLLESYKKECESILINKGIFEEVFVTFVEKQKQFKKIITVSSCKGWSRKVNYCSKFSLSFEKTWALSRSFGC